MPTSCALYGYCGGPTKANSPNLGKWGSTPVSEFPLQSRKTGQPVRGFIEEMTLVGCDQFPFDVFPGQEFINLVYQV